MKYLWKIIMNRDEEMVEKNGTQSLYLVTYLLFGSLYLL